MSNSEKISLGEAISLIDGILAKRPPPISPLKLNSRSNTVSAIANDNASASGLKIHFPNLPSDESRSGCIGELPGPIAAGTDKASIETDGSRVALSEFCGKIKAFFIRMEQLQMREALKDTCVEWRSLIGDLEYEFNFMDKRRKMKEVVDAGQLVQRNFDLVLLLYWASEHLVDLMLNNLNSNGKKASAASMSPSAILSQIGMIRDNCKLIWQKVNPKECISHYWSLEQLKTFLQQRQ